MEEGKVQGFIESVGWRVNLKNFMTCFHSMTVYEGFALRNEENATKSQRISVKLCKQDLNLERIPP